MAKPQNKRSDHRKQKKKQNNDKSIIFVAIGEVIRTILAATRFFL